MIGLPAVKPQSGASAVRRSGDRKIPPIGEGTYASCRYVKDEQHQREQSWAGEYV